jgi:Arc/MetJ family transcription regulator
MDVPIEIDDELLEETKRLLGESDSKEAVKRVLERYCEARRKYQDLLDIAGTVEFYEGYDPKKLRFSRYDPD